MHILLAGRYLPNLIERMVNMCKQNSCNNAIAIILSVVIGLGISVLFGLSLIPNAIFALWIAFGLSILSLIALLFLIPLAGFNNFSSLKKCMCEYSKNLIVGTIGTLVTTIAALSLTLTVSTALIIIFFLIGTFLSLLIISLTQFLWCLINSDCCKCMPCCND